MYKKVDANQREIVRALRDIGVSVCSLSPMGRGCPDLLIGWRGVNYLIEVKNLEGRGDNLTLDETKFIQTWRGQVATATSLDEILQIIGVVA